MPTKTLLGICLSLVGFTAPSCGHNDVLADRPAGWSCTYYFDNTNSPFRIIEALKAEQDPEKITQLIEQLKSLPQDRTQFACNGMKYPESSKQFHFADPGIQKARCMPLEHAKAYEDYLRNKINERCK